MKKEWDYNQWQGRSKRQVENNYKIMDWIFTGLAIFLAGFTIYNVIIHI